MLTFKVRKLAKIFSFTFQTFFHPQMKKIEIQPSILYSAFYIVLLLLDIALEKITQIYIQKFKIITNESFIFYIFSALSFIGLTPWLCGKPTHQVT